MVVTLRHHDGILGEIVGSVRFDAQNEVLYRTSWILEAEWQRMEKELRLAKLKAREQDRTNFLPNVEASFPGLDDLPLRLRDGTQSFSLSGDQVQSKGKALRIPISSSSGMGKWTLWELMCVNRS